MTEAAAVSTWLLLRTIGHAATLELQRRYGSRRVYIRATPDEADPVAQLIGLDAARALARECGGTAIKAGQHLVWRERNDRIRLFYHCGADPRGIAEHFGLTDRWVRKIIESEREPCT